MNHANSIENQTQESLEQLRGLKTRFLSNYQSPVYKI